MEIVALVMLEFELGDVVLVILEFEFEMEDVPFVISEELDAVEFAEGRPPADVSLRLVEFKAGAVTFDDVLLVSGPSE